MRRFFCFLLMLVLLLPCLVCAESDWASARLQRERQPEPIEIVPYDELPPVLNGQHHYLLLCIDQWSARPRPLDATPSDDAGTHKDNFGNTDGMVILTLDTRSKRVMLTSIIRDAIIRKVGSTDDKQKFGRINYVYNDYGPEALCRLLSEHLGIRIEKYILFNFGEIQDIIDLPCLNGVDIELNHNEIDYLAWYAVPRGSVVNAKGVDVWHNSAAPEGVYHMRGHSALLYMRIRKSSKGDTDFMRTQRVRNVLSALADKCRSFSLDDANSLANSILEISYHGYEGLDGSKYCQPTNISLREMLEAASYAYELRGCTIEELRIPAAEDVRPITHANMIAEEINWTAARQKVADFLERSWLVIDEDDDD